MTKTFYMRLTGVILPLWVSMPAQADAPPAQEFSLQNGLRIIVQEDHRAPVVISQVWYKVGASYEHDGITGISHALEHMMFKGTEKHGPNEFSRIVAQNGGEDNAFTGDDYTAYFQKLEKSRLQVSFELEADRMRGLKLTEPEFKKEMQVVMEERRLRTDDQPEALLSEAALAVAFQASPYRHPVIGWMDDIAHLTVDDLRGWYQRWYAPNNALVVVAGDVNPKDVFALAERYFGPLPKGDEIVPRNVQEPPQLGTKRVVVQAEAKVPTLLMTYKVPVLKTAIEARDRVLQRDCYALEVLSRILAGGESARLTRQLVRATQVAASASAGYDLNARLDSQFSIEGSPAHGRKVDALEAAIRKEVAALQDSMVSTAELQRVKTQVIASHVYERDSLFYQAMQIGLLAVVGLDWRLKDSFVSEIKAVTAADIRAVARKYLLDNRLTVAVLEPKHQEEKRHASAH